MGGYNIVEREYIHDYLIIVYELEECGKKKVGDRITIVNKVTYIISHYQNFLKIQPFVKDLHRHLEIDAVTSLDTEYVIMPDIRIYKQAFVGTKTVIRKNLSDFTVNIEIPVKYTKKIDISKKRFGNCLIFKNIEYYKLC